MRVKLKLEQICESTYEDSSGKCWALNITAIASETKPFPVISVGI